MPLLGHANGKITRAGHVSAKMVCPVTAGIIDEAFSDLL